MAKPNEPLHRLFLRLEPAEFIRRWNDTNPIRFEAPVGGGIAAWREQQAEVRDVLQIWDRGSLDSESRKTVAKAMNAGLKRYCVVKIGLNLKSFGPFARTDLDPKVAIRKPDELLGFVWLHMARLITGETAEKVCAQCGTAFKPKRSDARFCKPYCKLKAFRASQR